MYFYWEISIIWCSRIYFSFWGISLILYYDQQLIVVIVIVALLMKEIVTILVDCKITSFSLWPFSLVIKYYIVKINLGLLQLKSIKIMIYSKWVITIPVKKDYIQNIIPNTYIHM